MGEVVWSKSMPLWLALVRSAWIVFILVGSVGWLMMAGAEIGSRFGWGAIDRLPPLSQAMLEAMAAYILLNWAMTDLGKLVADLWGPRP